MRQVAVKLHDDIINHLDTIADSLSRPRSAILREAILAYLIKIKQTEPQIFKPYTFKSIHKE